MVSISGLGSDKLDIYYDIFPFGEKFVLVITNREDVPIYQWTFDEKGQAETYLDKMRDEYNCIPVYQKPVDRVLSKLTRKSK